MKSIFSFLMLSFLFVLIFSMFLLAQIPRTISYQGVLTDNSENPKADGDYDFTFSFYEAESGGDAIWSESKTLTVTKGLFSTSLGDVTLFGAEVKFDKPYWLGIKIGTEAELSPRIALTSSGYSFSSVNSDTTKNIINGKVVKSINGLKDNVTLEGSGGTTVSKSGNKITVSSSSGGGSGIQGIQNTDNAFSISSPTGPTATINLHSPFIINSDVGIGVNTPAAKLDVNGGSGSNADLGIHGSSNDNYGVYGTSNSSAGVFGESGSNFGVFARTYNLSSYAFLSGNGAGNKNYVGLSSGSYALFANGPAFFTKVGIGTEPEGYGFQLFVDGSSSNGTAIFGIGDYAGICGQGRNGGYAGVFNGNVNIFGTLAKTAGSFKIDHPLDPANKYLFHSFVESPDMKNIYDGIVTTDGNGSAIVNLPDWFGALNKDFRYQLTTIGQQAQAWIGAEIQNNSFTIKTDKPNVKVSWQVTGIRHDVYANQHRIPVEEYKKGDDRGKYLYPEGFGQPREEGISYLKMPKPKVDKQTINK